MTVDLSDQEWGQVMQILATAPWRDANPLLMKIGEQLRKGQDLTRAPAGAHTQDAGERIGRMGNANG